MKRIPWDIFLALLIGLGLGLVYSWMISPRITESDPSTLRADFKGDYRSAIAAAYAATGNLPRAQARLALLEDPNPVEALNAQAQRMLAVGESFQQADQIVDLALALQNGVAVQSTPMPTEAIAQEVDAVFTVTFPVPPSDVPFLLTETPPFIETQSEAITSTPRPTQTLPPTPGIPFSLTAQDTICDSNLPAGLLQIIVLNSNRRQMAGVKIIITWDGGEEQFFTGLKPELGNGYADYIMMPDITYTVQLASGSDMASGLSIPACQTSNDGTFSGGIKLTFQQPK